ncbi:unnamed protein product [Rhizoctonia solani]|uniref:Uncharacterized protein n=1 Tax=Rhizoctonia solani TaxID=456999 RepID=A0A8H2X242_9AGAM|nr:unnamed protein product [Rhizoctonia solani]
MVTFPQRAELWRQGVHQRLKEAAEDSDNPLFLSPDRGISATSGIPNYVSLLSEMPAAIELSQTTREESNEDYDVSQVLELREEQVIRALRGESQSEPTEDNHALPEAGTLSSSRTNTPGAKPDMESVEDISDDMSVPKPKRRGKKRGQASDEALTLYGGDYWRMQEQLRNKLNTIAYGARKKFGPMGVLQLSETIASVRARLKGQGFNDMEAAPPCGPAKTIEFYAKRAGVRLQTYPGGDYASCTNEERNRALADLPGDLFELVQVLHAHTGAEIYMIAAWRDENNTQRWTDAISSRSELFCETQDIQESRKNFVRFQIEHNYYHYGPSVEQAGPAVFWACDGSLRPWLPRVNKPLVYMQALLAEYFPLFYSWQGGQGELDYDTPNLVSPDRLPGGLTRLSPPHTWNESASLAVYKHILRSQINALEPEFQFQFDDLGAGLIQEGLCDSIHERSTLQFPVQSRYYVALLQNHTKETPEIQFELQGMLPFMGEDFEPYEPLLGEESTRLGELSGDYVAMLELLHSLPLLESAGPVQLFIFWFSIKTLHDEEEMPYRVRLHIETEATLQFLHQDIVWLTKQITDSVSRLRKIRGWKVSLFTSPIAIAVEQAALHVIPTLQGSSANTSEDELEEESSSSPQEPTPKQKETIVVGSSKTASTLSPGHLGKRTTRSMHPRQPSVVPENSSHTGESAQESEDDETGPGLRATDEPSEEPAPAASEQLDMDIDGEDQDITTLMDESELQYDVEDDTEHPNDTFADIASRAWILTLRELITLAERDACNDPPTVDQVRDRIPYWVDQLSSLLDKASEMGVIVQMAGLGEEGSQTTFLSSSASSFFDDKISESYGSGFRRWHGAQSLTSRLDTYGLPIFNDEDPLEVFSPSLIAIQEEYFSREGLSTAAKLVQCLNDINELENYGPAHGRRGIGMYETMTGVPFLLLPDQPHEYLDDQALSYIEQPVPDGLTSTRGANSNEIHGALIPFYFKRSPFMHAKSGTVYGGYNGVRLGMIMILRLLYHVHAHLDTPPASQSDKPGSSPDHPPEIVLSKKQILIYINQALYSLHQDVLKSRTRLQSMYMHRRQSLVTVPPHEELKTVPESKRTDRILRTPTTEKAMGVFAQMVAARKSTGEPARGNTTSTTPPIPRSRSPPSGPSHQPRGEPLVPSGNPKATKRAESTEAKPGPTARGPRKSVSTPDLAIVGVQGANASDSASLRVYQNLPTGKSARSSVAGNAPPPSVAGPPPPAPKPVSRHSPPSTDASVPEKKRTRAGANPTNDTKEKGPARKSGQSKRGGRGWKYVSDDEAPQAPEPAEGESDGSAPTARMRTRSNTRTQQTNTNTEKAEDPPRATSSVSAVTDNPPPLDPVADSSWAAPVTSHNLEFNMFAGAAVKRGAASSGKGTSAPPEGQSSSDPRGGGARSATQKKTRKR